MESCSCGVARKQFWLWRDGSNVLHASRFEPSGVVEGSVRAVNAFDAVASTAPDISPKHDVEVLGDGANTRQGRCSLVTAI